MSLEVELDFLPGEPTGKAGSIQDVLSRTAEGQSALATMSIEDVLAVLEHFSDRLLDRNEEIHRRFPDAGVPFVAGWCRSPNLRSFLGDAFGDPGCLDRFVRSRHREERMYRAFPAGLVTQWMAGNVPTLGFLALVQAVITKNAGLIKVASEADRFLGSLLALLADVEKDVTQQEAIAASVAAIRYDRSRQDIGAYLSEQSDVRVFWGSDEAVQALQALQALPARSEAVDVVFANKTSLAVVGRSAIESESIATVARRIATDISVFEQKACASPHTLFLETDSDEDLERFALCLVDALSNALKSIPKMPPTPKEVSALLNLRAQYDMFHRAWYSQGTEFTILSDDLFQLGPAVGNRTLYLRRVHSLDRVVELITPHVQSVGIQADAEQLERITELFGSAGVQRFVPVGMMTHFESPWNGGFLLKKLVRWASRPVIKDQA